jgi:hypothetical protein
MMASNIEYALMSANVYGNAPSVRAEDNTLPVPDGWTAFGPVVVLADGRWVKPRRG